MNSPNEEQERMKERIVNACIDALQRYPDMGSAIQQYIGEFLLCGTSGSIPLANYFSYPYRWLVPLHPYTELPSHPLDIDLWARCLRNYCEMSGYKETLTNETDD